MPITVACSLILKTVGVFLLAVLPVSVKNNAGESFEGDLGGFTGSSLLLNQTGKVAEFRFDDLLILRSDDAEEEMGPRFRVTLIDGNRIAAQDLTLTDSELLIEPRRQNQLRVPVKQVKAVRFRRGSQFTDAAWLGIVDRESRGDTLVIRRSSDRLDPQEGVIAAIENGKVVFDLEGQIVNAPIDRLEGVVFGGLQPVLEDAEIRVNDIYGSVWSVLSIEPSKGDQPLQMRISPSLIHPLPLHHIESIRWSSGFSMLADEKPASTSFQTYFETRVDGNMMEDFFGPTRDGDADLLMFGGSSIEYRIERGYQTFAGSVRRHEQVTSAGLVTVRVELDGKTVWEQSLKDGEPLGFELPVDRSRRLAIKVDSGDDGDLGDKVRISRPRLLK